MTKTEQELLKEIKNNSKDLDKDQKLYVKGVIDGMVASKKSEQ